MARAKKKVQGKSFFGSKVFYIIIGSIIGALVIAATIWAIVTYYNVIDDPDPTDFTEEKFIPYKVNYAEIDNIVNGTYQHIFVFLYDGQEFDIDENKEDKKLYEALEKLLTRIEEKNLLADGKVIEFCLLDTSLVGNSGALTNTKLGAYQVAPGLAYIYGDTYTSKTPDVEDETKKDIIAGTAELESIIMNANGYVQNLVI